MTTAVQRRRGTTTEHASFTGLEGEISVNTTKETLVVHDGSTAGGFELARADGSNFVATSVDINGGTIDGTTIGASSASTGAFTTLTASGEITANGGIALGDNDKATFGAGDDLQIFHNGTESFIREVGEGGLKIDSNGPEITLRVNATENALMAESNGAVTVYYNNVAKLATTATGIDVTGTATMDGLTVDGNNDIQINRNGVTAVKLFFDRSGTVDGSLELGVDENLTLSVADDGRAGQYIYFNNNTKRVMALADGGDISFYEDTGTTAKFFWDASAEFLGIGTTTPTVNGESLRLVNGLYLNGGGTEDVPAIGLGDTNSGLFGSTYVAVTTQGQERFRVDTGGNVGIGVTPSELLHIQSDTTSPAILVKAGSQAGSTTPTAELILASGSLSSNDSACKVISYRIGDYSSAAVRTSGLKFQTTNANAPVNAMSLDNSGNLQLSGKFVSGTGATAAATLNAYSRTVSTNLPSALRVIENTTASSYWDIGSTDGASNNLNFYANANTTPKMTLSGAGNLLVGTTSTIPFLFTTGSGAGITSSGTFMAGAAAESGLFNRVGSEGKILGFYKSGTPVGSIGTKGNEMWIGTGDTGVYFASGSDALLPYNTTTNALRTDGEVSLGDSSRNFKNLYLSGGVYGGGSFSAGTTGNGVFFAEGVAHIFRRGSSGGYQEFGRFDTSGNLLVGKTTTNYANVGAELKADGKVYSTVSGGTSLVLNRKTNDGDIISFYKDNDPVGSIGNDGLTLTIGTVDTGFRFVDSVDSVSPFSVSQGVATDGQMNLGRNVTRFKDLYLSGNVNLTGGKISSYAADASAPYFADGGNVGIRLSQAGVDDIVPCSSTGADRDNGINFGAAGARWGTIFAATGTINTSDQNEKQDIAELSEAEQRVAVAAKGLLRKFRWKDSVAEKGDEARIHFGVMAQDLQAAFAAEGLDASDYAMWCSDTWTDKETNEEKTRLGVRYSELLAFIIAAI